jgi:hypothetical protein
MVSILVLDFNLKSLKIFESPSFKKEDASKNELIDLILKRTRTNQEYELNVRNLIGRVIDEKHNLDDFLVVIDEKLKENGIDTFQVTFKTQ